MLKAPCHATLSEAGAGIRVVLINMHSLSFLLDVLMCAYTLSSAVFSSGAIPNEF